VDDLWATKSEGVGLMFVQLASKIFNLCGHDPPTSQTDRWTDDMRSQDRALHYSGGVCWCKRLADGWGTTATTRVPGLQIGERPREWTRG